MNWGQNLKRARERKGLSQMALSEQIGVSQPTLAQYESNMKFPTFLPIVNLERALGVSMQELYDEKEETK